MCFHSLTFKGQAGLGLSGMEWERVNNRVVKNWEVCLGGIYINIEDLWQSSESEATKGSKGFKISL